MIVLVFDLNLMLLLRLVKVIQRLTCVSVRFKLLENSALSAIDKYCLVLNLRSSARSCCVVKGVRGFLLLLCLRRAHLTAILGGSPGSREKKVQKTNNYFNIISTLMDDQNINICDA